MSRPGTFAAAASWGNTFGKGAVGSEGVARTLSRTRRPGRATGNAEAGAAAYGLNPTIATSEGRPKAWTWVGSAGSREASGEKATDSTSVIAPGGPERGVSSKASGGGIRAQGLRRDRGGMDAGHLEGRPPRPQG
jgi:hypothetical protein